MKYICPLIVVSDIKSSRDFYERILGQKVKYDFGENVQFEGDFSIHLEKHYKELLGNGNREIKKKANNFELYFETNKIDNIICMLKENEIEIIHEIIEQPWGQRVTRFYDPDYHIIEVGEKMESVVLRYYQAGMSVEEMMKRTSLPKVFIERTILQQDLK